MGQKESVEEVYFPESYLIMDMRYAAMHYCSNQHTKYSYE